MNRWSVVSPWLPNGVTYLLNIFLELDLLVYRCPIPSSGPFANSWIRKGRRHLIRQDEFKALRPYLPSLLEDHLYLFEKDVQVHWYHPLELEEYADVGLLVYVRDPRDSLFSWFRRQKKLGNVDADMSFEKYLLTPNVRFKAIHAHFVKKESSNFPLLFRDHWLKHEGRLIDQNYGDQIDDLMAIYECYLSRWSAESSKTALVVRYEDMKEMPLLCTKNILNVMGVARECNEVSKAIEKSSFEVGRQLEILRSGTSTVLLKGTPYEWKQNPEEAKGYELISDRLQPLLALLGYAPYSS